ncbi:MAG: hypothetical protein ACLR2E_19215 [Lachnospiraceae bacterium]
MNYWKQQEIDGDWNAENRFCGILLPVSKPAVISVIILWSFSGIME